jgi:hypothetical protein
MTIGKHSSRTTHIVRFGKNEFATKKDATAYVRNLLHRIGETKSVRGDDPEKYTELCDVLRCHPNQESKLKDMVDILIRPNRLNKKGLEVHVVKSTGSGKKITEDISWTICVSGRKRSFLRELMSAMRFSIDSQIREYKRSIAPTPLVCVQCNIDNRPVHVDHVVHFEKLAKEFLDTTSQNHPIDLCSASDGSNRRDFLNRDNLFAEEWKAYHKQHAMLRILCDHCNLTRTKHKPCT